MSVRRRDMADYNLTRSSRQTLYMRFALALMLLPALFAQAPASPTIPKLTDVNPEILNLVIYDQWDRGNDMFGSDHGTDEHKIAWDVVSKRDEQRRDAVRKLLADSKLSTGKDYRFAALIFQHSPDTAGYLLAHVLAVTAAGKGDASAKWLAAATMDRYLQSLNQPQVFGTQFRQPQPEGSWTMEPFDRSAISDAVRATWCVIPLAEQDRIVGDMQAGKPIRGTRTEDCK
jgi:hypothetical protein